MYTVETKDFLYITDRCPGCKVTKVLDTSFDTCPFTNLFR